MKSIDALMNMIAEEDSPLAKAAQKEWVAFRKLFEENNGSLPDLIAKATVPGKNVCPVCKRPRE